MGGRIMEYYDVVPYGTNRNLQMNVCIPQTTEEATFNIC